MSRGGAHERKAPVNNDPREVNNWCARCGRRFTRHVHSRGAWCEDCITETEGTE